MIRKLLNKRSKRLKNIERRQDVEKAISYLKKHHSEVQKKIVETPSESYRKDYSVDQEKLTIAIKILEERLENMF